MSAPSLSAGPASDVIIFRVLRLIAIFGILTLLTQIGGLVFLVAYAAVKILLPLGWTGRTVQRAVILLLFVILYTIATIILVPAIAASIGRPALPCSKIQQRPVQALKPIYCILNRNYATPRMHKMLDALGAHLNVQWPGMKIRYLDAGFPFLSRFPMLPHLSHGDGAAVDLAFFYTDGATGQPIDDARSPFGYWAFEQPRHETDRICTTQRSFGSLRWDMEGLQQVWPDRPLDEARTSAMLEWLATDGPNFGIKRAFLEPHLTARFGLASPMFRFQGCRAARHDDHVHVELDEG